MQRPAPPQVVPAPQSLAQPPPNIPSLPQAQQHKTIPNKHKRRDKAIPIIDPLTGKLILSMGFYNKNKLTRNSLPCLLFIVIFLGKDKLNELYNEDDSHPPSGESSARATPQPICKEMQNVFVKQVVHANNTNNDENLDDMTDHSHTDHIESHIYHNAQAVQNSNRLDLAQSSKLQVINLLKQLWLLIDDTQFY